MKKSSEEYARLLHEKLFYYSLLIGIPICSTLFFASEDLINLIYGSDFLGASEILKFLSIAVFLQFFTPLISNLIISAGHQRLIILIGSIGAIFNVILNLILIPTWGIKASAMITILTNLVVSVVGIYFVKHYLGFFFVPRSEKTMTPVLGGAVMIAVTLLSTNFIFPLISTALGLIIYFVIVFLRKGTWYYDLKALRLSS
jgi:O-antigen/teichoic acid export membrane protein